MRQFLIILNFWLQYLYILFLSLTFFLHPPLAVLKGQRRRSDFTSASCQGDRRLVQSAGAGPPGVYSERGQSAGAAHCNPPECERHAWRPLASLSPCIWTHPQSS